jgi:hypothetical protein
MKGKQMKIFFSIICLCLFVLAVCEPSVSYQQYREGKQVDIQNQIEDRITVKRIAVMHDDIAYSDYRGVYLITDNKTGKEYIGLSGVGISESGSHQSGKASISDKRQ